MAETLSKRTRVETRSSFGLRLLLIGLGILVVVALIVRAKTEDRGSRDALVDDLLEARRAASEGVLGREFFLSRLDDPLHALEGELFTLDGPSGDRMRRAISGVESAIDGHLALEGGPTSTVDAVDELTREVCVAIEKLDSSAPAKCS